MELRTRSIRATLATLLALPGLASAQVDCAPYLGESSAAFTLQDGRVLVDLDGDEVDDLVVPKSGADWVIVRPGLGDGLFGNFSINNVGEAPVAAAAGDLDGDDVSDIVTANRDSDDVSVLLGVGDGSFGPSTEFPAGEQPLDIGVGDFDRDRVVDVAVAISTPDQVSILFGDGSGALGPTVALAGPGVDPKRVVVEDVDADGALDLLVQDGNTRVVLFRGSGDGSFATPLDLPAATLEAMAIDDVDGDGIPDLLVSAVPGVLNLFLGSGDGTFRSGPIVPTTLLEAGVPHLADLDGDTRVDLLLESEQHVTSLLAQPDGSFVEQPAQAIFPSEISERMLLDIDGDETVDMLTFRQGDVVAYTGQGDGSFLLPASVDIAGSATDTRAVALADLDGDGWLDAALTDARTDQVWTLVNDGLGSFVPLAPHPVGPDPYDVAAVDVDMDGIPDVVTADRPAGVSVLLGVGNGTLQPALQYPSGKGEVIDVADIDQDGLPDIAMANGLAETVSILRNRGHGTFGPPAPVPVARTPFGLALVDLNNDGRVDIVTTNRNNDRVSVVLKKASGDFGLIHEFKGIRHNVYLAVSDLDLDGRLDVVVVSNTEAEAGVLFGNGDGTLRPAEKHGLPRDGSTLALGDVDGDGRVDVVPGMDAGLVSWLAATGGPPHLEPARSFALGGLCRDLALGDLDKDGALDVVAATGVSQYNTPDEPVADLTILRGLCEPVWKDLGKSLAGTGAAPELTGIGPLVAGGEQFQLQITGALPSTSTHLFAGQQQIDLPFFGGTLVPAFMPPDGNFVVFLTNLQGNKKLTASLPHSFPAGLELFLHAWCVDAAAPFGMAATNALATTVQAP